MDPTDRMDDDNWHGGFYELAIWMEERDDEVLMRALRAVWASRELEGPWVRGEGMTELPLSFDSRDAWIHNDPGHPRGVATLAGGVRMVCGSVAFVGCTEYPDSFCFYVPMGALARADARVGGYPFGRADSLCWRLPIDTWLAQMCLRVHASSPIRRALIGHEASSRLDDQSEPLTRGTRRVMSSLTRDGTDLTFLPATHETLR